MKKLKILLVVCLLLIAAGISTLIFLYVRHKNTVGYLRGTTMNGSNITGKTPEEAAALLSDQFKDFNVSLTEDGKDVLTGNIRDYGYIFDEDTVLSALREEYRAEKANFFSVYRTLSMGRTIQLEEARRFDEKVFTSFVTSASLSVPRVASSPAQVVLKEDGSEYVIQDAVRGNEIDDSKLRAFVKKSIAEALAGEENETRDRLSLAIPADCYTSKDIPSDQAALQEELKKKNQELKLQNTYKDMSVTYTFGEETKVLDSASILGWLSFDDQDQIVVNEDSVRAYVSELAGEYNTRSGTRTFTATGGQTVSFYGGDNLYGYTIDEEAETAQLKADILAAQSVTREPVYYDTNSYGNPLYLSRNGKDDLNGTYVEVSLTAQHLWFYKDGSLIVESDVVTGDVSRKRETTVGVFPLAYKESPSILRGGDAADGYETKVEYWMPFHEGQGLHDAYWRGAFGGSIYQYDGSHGCVNLPPSVAQTIFENISAGTAIIIYK